MEWVGWLPISTPMRQDGAMSLERRMDVLSKSAWFQNLPTNALAELAAHGRVRKLSRGQVLFTANEPADGMYIVLSGSVRAFRENIDGREQTIHVESVGGMLAEVPVFDGGPYPSTTMAEEDSELLFLAKEDVRRFLLQHPEAALTALAILAEETAVGRIAGRATLIERCDPTTGDVVARRSPAKKSEAEGWRILFPSTVAYATCIPARLGTRGGHAQLTEAGAAGNPDHPWPSDHDSRPASTPRPSISPSESSTCGRLPALGSKSKSRLVDMPSKAHAGARKLSMHGTVICVTEESA